MQHNAKTEEGVHLLKYICHPHNISHINLIIKMPRITLSVHFYINNADNVDRKYAAVCSTRHSRQDMQYGMQKQISAMWSKAWVVAELWENLINVKL